MKRWIYVVAISYQPNKNNGKLFAKEAHLKPSRHILAICVALSLMVADYHFHSVNQIRSVISAVIFPIQYAVDYPVRVIAWLHELVGSKKSLIDENIELRYKQTQLEAELQKLLVISDENAQLKELLLATPSAKTPSMVAQILAVDTTNARQILVLNKGKRDGVFVGQVVLDAKGIMGQIVDVGLMTSTVLLISDSKCAVPVRNNRTGERAILAGNNHLTQLSLLNLPKTSSILVGDLLVTSGLGRLYPEGYPVGEVTSVNDIPGEEFIKVDVKPVALLNRSRLVLLIWPEREFSLVSAQINERLNKLKAMS